jgi:hypothetical protein
VDGHTGVALSNLARKGGIAASILLIALGLGAIVAGFAKRDTLAKEQIVGKPTGDEAAAAKVANPARGMEPRTATVQRHG